MAENAALMTTQEVADRLRVSRATVVRWAKDGTIPGAVRIGREFRFATGAVEQLLQPASAQEAQA